MLTLQDLLKAGGPMAQVRAAADEAARAEAADWVEILTNLIADYEPTDANDLLLLGIMHGWLKQMRRIAGITPVSYTHLTLPTNREV